MNQTSTTVAARPTHTTRETCRLCGGQWLIQFLDLGNLHLSDFVLPGDPLPPRVPLRLAICSACNLVQLMETTDPDLLYRRFWYRSGTNYTMANEMKRLAALAAELGPSGPGATWLDIGANDGTLLSHAPAGTIRIAVEPALNLREPLLQHADQVISDYFHADQVGAVDTVFTAAMFYDLDRPLEFVDEIAHTLKPGGLWINQLSYTPLMLSRLAFDNICHEHLAYYTLATLETLYHLADMRIIDVSLNDINGGSMCVVAVHQSDPRPESSQVSELRRAEENLRLEDWFRFARDVRDWKQRSTTALKAMDGPVHVYGASTKGNTLLQYLEADSTWFECASDRNPDKWGRVTSGTRIPIVSEAESRAKDPGAYLVLPWAFREEFIKREANFLEKGGKLVFPLPKLEVIVG